MDIGIDKVILWQRIVVQHLLRSFDLSKALALRGKKGFCLSAISMSSEQCQTATTKRFGLVEPYVALCTHGEGREFVEVGNLVPDSSLKTFATDLGLAILRNGMSTDSCHCGQLDACRSSRRFSPLDAWKEAFPFSTRSVYLARDGWYSWQFYLPPNLLKHVRGLLVAVWNRKAGSSTTD